MVSNIVNTIVFLPALLILAGLCTYGALWALFFAFGFGGSPAKGLKIGKNVNEKTFNKGGK